MQANEDNVTILGPVSGLLPEPRCEYSQLRQSRPFIAWMLIQAVGQNNTEIHYWCRQKDRDIVRFCRFPERSWRFLGRICGDSFDIGTLWGLRETFADSANLKAACHLHGGIGKQVLAILSDPLLFSMMSYKMLRDIHRMEHDFCCPDVVGMLSTVKLLIEFDEHCSPLPTFNTLHQLEECVRDIEDYNISGRYAAIRRHRFPPPPFPATKYILPLTSPRSLTHEAVSQGNTCVARRYYCRLVARGWVYLYRVLWPQRATLEIVYVASSDEWEVAELLGAHNQEVNAHTLAIVLQWLKANQGTARLRKNRSRQLLLFE